MRQLLFVRQHLKLTAGARSEVGTLRRHAFSARGRREEFDEVDFHPRVIVGFLRIRLREDFIARHGVGDDVDEIVVFVWTVGEAFAR